MHRFPLLAVTLLCLTVVLLPSPAKADLYFNIPFSNPTVPPGSPPWLTALFEPINASQVRLTIHNLLVPTSDQFVSKINFNVTPDAAGISIVPSPTGSGAPAFDGLEHMNNAFNAGGGGRYDLLFKFNTAASDPRFIGGQTFVAILERAGGLAPADFELKAEPRGGAGPYYAAAHVQGSAYGNGSAWLAGELTAVPEPSTVLLFGSCLAVVIYRIRRRCR